FGVKLYPAGATTHSDEGVTDIKRFYAALERMEALGLPLLVHGEVADPQVDVFDREARFIEQVLIPLRQRFKKLKVVFEHITTKEAVDYVKTAEESIAATVTPQHMRYSRNELFRGGIRPHAYCLPVLKRESHRRAVLEAATSGHPRFFLGTDSAPHARHVKETSCGCAGIYSAHAAMELYATLFEQAGALDRLEAFASFHGPDFYGLSRNSEKLKLKREEWQVPAQYPFGDAEELVPMCAGERLGWRVV
ncbi:MAG: dihydroorotase, partial [Nevskiales bacterium]